MAAGPGTTSGPATSGPGSTTAPGGPSTPAPMGTPADGAAPGAGTAARDAGARPEADATPPPAAPRPAGPVDPSCKLPGAAFCDTFEKASPGGRGGDLDDNVWSFARLGLAAGGANFGFIPTPIDLCGKMMTVPYTEDSQLCKTADGDHRWAEAFDDGHSFVYNAGRIRQPFDFAGRTGTIQFEVDARTSGGHGWWVEAWITDAPIPGPNHHDPQIVTSREAIGIAFSDDCGGPIAPGSAGAPFVGVSEILVTRGYVPKNVDFQGKFPRGPVACAAAKGGSLNLVQIRLSTSRVEVWMSDAGARDLRKIASADVNLGFSRGYVHLTHVQYNASKAGNLGGAVVDYATYQWARPSFDGPKLPAPRGYTLPDSLVPMSLNGALSAGGLSIGYVVSNDITSDGSKARTVPVDLRFKGVDTAGATAARLTFNTVGVKGGDVLRYRLNGKAWHEYPVPPELPSTWERQGFAVPVPVSDLVPGDNSVEFGTSAHPYFFPPNSMYIANIDLEVEAP